MDTPEGMLPSSLPPRRWKLGDESPVGEAAAELPKTVAQSLKKVCQTTLEELPPEYGEKGGLWITARSRNPFEVLLLDPMSECSSDALAKRQRLVGRFWAQKITVARQGATRRLVEEKYGKDIENYAENVQWAYEQLSTQGGSAFWRDRCEMLRLQEAWNRTSELVEATLVDGVLDPSESGLLMQRAEHSGYDREEFSKILLNILRERRFEPDATPVGASESERISSVRWLTAQAKELPLPKPLAIPPQAHEAVAAWPFPSSEVSDITHGPSSAVFPTPEADATASFSTSPPSTLGRIVVVVSLVIIFVAVIAYIVFGGSFESRVDKALAEGHFFTPPGNNVAELWVAENAGHPGSESVRRAADKIKGVMAPKGDDAFSRWYHDSDDTVDWDEMSRLYALLDTMFPNESLFKVRAKYSEAQKLLRGHDYAGALGDYNAVVQIDSCNVLALNGLGKIYIRDDSPFRDKPRGLEYYQRASQCDPKFTWAFTNLGTYYMLETNWAAAEKYMLLGLQTSPGRPAILRSLGRINFNMKHYSQALGFYQQSLATERDPEQIAKANNSMTQIREKMR